MTDPFDDEERLDTALRPAFEPMAPPPGFEEDLLGRLEDRLAERRRPTVDDGVATESVEVVELEPSRPEGPRQSMRRGAIMAAAAAVVLVIGGVMWAAQGTDDGEGVAADATAVDEAIEAIDGACAATLPGLDPAPASFDGAFEDYSLEERAVAQLRTLVDGIQPAIEDAEGERLLTDITNSWDDLVVELEDIERLVAAGDVGFVGQRVLRIIGDVQEILGELDARGAAACTW